MLGDCVKILLRLIVGTMNMGDYKTSLKKYEQI